MVYFPGMTSFNRRIFFSLNGWVANAGLDEGRLLHGGLVVGERVEAHLAVVGADAGILHAAEAHGVATRVNDHVVDGGPAATHGI